MAGSIRVDSHGTAQKQNKKAFVSVAIEEGFASGEELWYLRSPLGIKQRMDQVAEFFNFIASKYDEFGIEAQKETAV